MKPDSKEFKSLIALLDDPDEEIYSNIFSKLCEYGKVVIPHLESEWEHNLDEIVQQRVEDVIHTIQYDEVKSEMKIWALNMPENLMKVLLIINKYFYPEIENQSIIQKIEHIKKEIWLELNGQLTPLEQVRVFNLIFFKHFNFQINFDQLHSPKNNFINYIIETKKSNHFGIGLLYLLIAQQLKLPIYGVRLKMQFVLCYIDSDIFQSNIDYINANDILFYINPSNAGAIFKKPQIVDYLAKIRTEPKDYYYFPSSIKDIIIDFLTSIANDFKSNNEEDRYDEIILLKKIITA